MPVTFTFKSVTVSVALEDDQALVRLLPNEVKKKYQAFCENVSPGMHQELGRPHGMRFQVQATRNRVRLTITRLQDVGISIAWLRDFEKKHRLVGDYTFIVIPGGAKDPDIQALIDRNVHEMQRWDFELTI